MANIGELPYGVLGTAPKFGSAKKLNLSQFFFFFTVLFVQVVKKSALDVQNLLFFFYLLGSLPSPSPWPSSLLPGFIDLCKPLGIRTRF